MRDIETMEAAINAAETGHLVFSTLHSLNAMQTVDRIINMFPPHHHAFLQLQLAQLLEGVVSQRLLPTKDGTARMPAIELMAATPTIQELLLQLQIVAVELAERTRLVGPDVQLGDHLLHALVAHVMEHVQRHRRFRAEQATQYIGPARMTLHPSPDVEQAPLVRQ